MLQLCEQRNSLNIDTLYRFASEANALALSTGNRKARSLITQDIALYYASNKKLDTALQIVSTELKEIDTVKTPDLHLSLSLTKARLLYRNNQYKEALQALFAVLTAAEKQNNTFYQVMAKTGIGWLQLDMRQHADALSWFYQALNAASSENQLSAYSALYSNLATTHQALGHADSALFYSEKAVSNARLHENLNFLATSLRIKADILMHLRRYPEAEKALGEVVSVRKVIDGPFFVSYDMSLLAHFYAQTGQPDKGIALCKAVIDAALQTGITTQLHLMYEALAANYKAGGDHKAWGETLERAKALQDSLYTLNTNQLLSDFQSKYEVQKKEKVILQQQFDLTLKNYWLYGVLFLLLIVVLASYLLSRSAKRKQQLKLLLVQEEEKRKSEKAILVAEEAERKRIAADLHDSLGAYAASIAANIEQLNAALPVHSKPVLQELHHNAGNIVAQLNDTIWVLKKDALLLTAIGDRLKMFIQRLQTSYPHVLIDVTENIEKDYLLPPSQAFHLFQITKEAVINALRHSRCTQVTILIEAGAGWRFSISDNGSGLEQKTTVAEGGNGLQNMQQRAQESGYKIHWVNNAPNGTRVIIEPTTN